MATKYPVRLLVKGKRCGCRFGYAAGFKIVCEFHIAQREAIATKRREANATPILLHPQVPVRKKHKLLVDSPELVEGIRTEIAARNKAMQRARFRIERKLGLTTAKTLKNFTSCIHHKDKRGKSSGIVIPARAWRKLQAYMTQYAFTAEQVRKEMK